MNKNSVIDEEAKEKYEDVPGFKRKPPKKIPSPSLSIFNGSLTDSLVRSTEALSLSLPSTRSLRERARTFGSDIKRMRSKSCERVLQRCRRSLEKVVRKDPQPADYFHQNATLRRSRRSAKTKAKPCRQSYDSYARAIVNSTPSPYDTDGLPLRVGDLIGVISRHPSGMWVGECEGRVGRFKFINVEMVETKSDTCQSLPDQENISSMSDLLDKLGLSHLTSKLELNGFDQLETLETVTRKDLEFLAITNREEQEKLIEAGAILRTCPVQKENAQERLDSGCYDCTNCDEDLTSSRPISVHRVQKHELASTLSCTPRSSLCSSSGDREEEEESSTLSLESRKCQSRNKHELSVFSSMASLPVREGHTFTVVHERMMDGLTDVDRRMTKYSPARRGISILSSCEGEDSAF